MSDKEMKKPAIRWNPMRKLIETTIDGVWKPIGITPKELKKCKQEKLNGKAKLDFNPLETLKGFESKKNMTCKHKRKVTGLASILATGGVTASGYCPDCRKFYFVNHWKSMDDLKVKDNKITLTFELFEASVS